MIIYISKEMPYHTLENISPKILNNNKINKAKIINFQIILGIIEEEKGKEQCIQGDMMKRNPN